MAAIQILGRIRVIADSGREIDLGPTARRAAFALLVLAEGKSVPRVERIATLWGGDPPPSATDVWLTHVKHRRRLLGPGREACAPSLLRSHRRGQVSAGPALDAEHPRSIPGWAVLCGP